MALEVVERWFAPECFTIPRARSKIDTRSEGPMKKVSMLVLVALGVARMVTAAALPFIQDNYAAALSKAKQGKLPIFVECWAPW
jgi:hypothetical protein